MVAGRPQVQAVDGLPPAVRVAGFYRTCVIDGVLEHSSADYVRRPSVLPKSPTLWLTHLQFEAMLTAARQSPNAFDFPLVCLLGLLELRIFETVGADIDDLGEEHGHQVRRVWGMGCKVVLVPLPAAVSRAVDQAAAATRRHDDCASSRPSLACDYRVSPHAQTSVRDHPARRRSRLARRADRPASRPRTTMRYNRVHKNLDLHPNYILAAYMASGT